LGYGVNTKKIFKMKKEIKQEDLWCEYTDLPSPIAYGKCCDYDSMGNHGRFPKTKNKKSKNMKRTIQKLILWLSFKFPKKKRKSIWDL
jgi:hypothetical protein